MLVVLSAIINCSLGITLTIKCFFSQRVFSIVKIAISIVSINLLNLDFFINNVFQSLISFNLLGSHIMLMIRMDRQILVNNQMMVLCTSSIHHFSLSSIGIFWMEFQQISSLRYTGLCSLNWLESSTKNRQSHFCRDQIGVFRYFKQSSMFKSIP